jgi:hypothetical protein
MSATLQSIEMQIIPAYNNDEFHLVGVRAVATIHIPAGSGWIIQTIESPGLWGIESDSGDDYFAELFEEEKEQVLDMLKELNVSTEAL